MRHAESEGNTSEAAEPLLQKCKQDGADPKIKMDLNKISNIASEFSKDWKNGIKRINQSVLCFFSKLGARERDTCATKGGPPLLRRRRVLGLSLHCVNAIGIEGSVEVG